jgi:hypothetical protein
VTLNHVPVRRPLAAWLGPLGPEERNAAGATGVSGVALRCALRLVRTRAAVARSLRLSDRERPVTVKATTRS